MNWIFELLQLSLRHYALHLAELVSDAAASTTFSTSLFLSDINFTHFLQALTRGHSSIFIYHTIRRFSSQNLELAVGDNFFFIYRKVTSTSWDSYKCRLMYWTKQICLSPDEQLVCRGSNSRRKILGYSLKVGHLNFYTNSRRLN
jgi:hypothetical protein